MFASKSRKAFFITPSETSPEDLVEITDDIHQALLVAESSGMVINWDTTDGIPMAVEKVITPPLPLTRVEVEMQRNAKYASPRDGSDRWFAEASRLSFMGGTVDEVKAARGKGVARYEEIRLEYPYPAS